MAKAIGQPYHPTHPHILADGHITPGITQVEYRLRRHQFAQSLTPNTMVIFPAYKTRYSSLNILYLVPHMIHLLLQLSISTE